MSLVNLLPLVSDRPRRRHRDHRSGHGTTDPFAVPDAPRDAAARVVGRVQGSVLDPCRPRTVHGRQRQPQDDGVLGGTTTAATTIPTTITTTVPITIPTVPTTTATTAPPPQDGGDGDRPGNKILIGGHNVKLVSVAGNGKKLDV